MSELPRSIKTVGRRFFLRGTAGAIVGLPLLESFLPARAQEEDVIHRFAIFMRQGNGCQQELINNQNPAASEPDRFWPSQLGNLTTAGMQGDGDRAVNVLAEFASKLLIVRGTQMVRSLQEAGCGHSQGGLLCLTAARADGEYVEKALATGESIDNRIVRDLEGEGAEPLTLRAGPRSGYLDDVLSYSASRTRRVAESNPFSAYKALFGLPEVDDTERVALRRKSVNDLVRNEMGALLASSRLSQLDRDRLEAHRAAIRDLEVQMQCELPPELLDPLSQVSTGQAESDDFVVTAARFQAQVIALAMNCGRTHAATLQIGNGNDQTQYTINGQKYERFHHISHRINSDGSDGTQIEGAALKHHEVDKLFAGIFLGLLEELSRYQTPRGTLLDDGVAIWVNDLSNGPPHSTDNMPFVCAGSCGGRLKTGVYIDAGNHPQRQYVGHQKFLSTIGAAVGCKNGAGQPLDDFGDPELETGRIPQMEV